MTADTAPACNHTRLAFGSSGYYVMCRDCPQTWVARRIGAELDTDLGIGTLTTYTGTLEPPAEVAALVEAARRDEREANAAIANERGAWASNDADAESLVDRLEANGRMDMAKEIAAAIRARSTEEAHHDAR